MTFTNPLKLTSAIIFIAILAGCMHYVNQPEASASSQSTNNAYIQADMSTVAAQISGTTDQILVTENQPVKAGDLLLSIDNRDFVLAVEAAKAQVESAQANIGSLAAQLTQQESTILKAQATVKANQARLQLAKADQKRFSNLAEDGSGSIQALQQANTQLTVERTNLSKTQAELAYAQQQTHVLQAQLNTAKAALLLAKADLHARELKLSYTKVYAPIDGVVGKKIVQLGDFVNAGKPLIVIVPTKSLYITANYRETQLANVQMGQPVSIEVDALPGVELSGKVESLGPASGVSYAAIAPHNATGNFTKIVQRLPVKISIDMTQKNASKLRVGMSVIPTIETGDTHQLM
ncbi:HlyD family secretion protein [Amphritea opalescens]|uniref:HlyD family secretion protein n=1 Tax=Amphritea opalescens TaxID=2490544 RepID=A0A430KVI9_9GAMM|nr:HlyD family secretion protein [Amphritea opalescens]RTE67486.1 HlyD family secretion protein [Amphritea opalescens]